MNRKSVIILVFIIGLAIGIPVGWYLLSPLWINEEVNESFPTAPVSASTEASMPEAEPTTAMATAMAEPDKMMEETMPAGEMSVLAQGSFYDIAHIGAGQALVYQLADGSRILRLQDFEVDNGPDLHVYLVPIDPVPDSVGVEIPGSVDLGELKGNIGDQNYDIPDDVDLSQFQSVVIWCQPFRVPFTAAALGQ
ncbi:MAG TPA: DM13 domain-containing protein [Anaerolineales bacterium]|nr:DM13 domain-containing protein [Anaerolineales bacterium]